MWSIDYVKIWTAENIEILVESGQDLRVEDNVNEQDINEDEDDASSGCERLENYCVVLLRVLTSPPLKIPSSPLHDKLLGKVFYYIY